MEFTTSLIVPLTGITVQPVLTTILAARDMSYAASIGFFFLCDDLVNGYDVTIESGETSDALDASFIGTVYVPPKAAGLRGQNSFLVGPDQLRAFYRVSAISRGGGAVAGAWTLKITRRYNESNAR